jgi:IS5 family transposase
MDGRLWNKLYREICITCKCFIPKRRPGRPRTYQTKEILAVWTFAAMMDWPISLAQKRLAGGSAGWWLRRYWSWPMRVPSLPTLTRRARQPDFRRLLRQILHRLIRHLRRKSVSRAVMDATILCTGPYSRDPESRWTCRGGKWFRGYTLHTICDENGLLLVWFVTSANVQEMAAARKLVRKLAAVGQGRIKLLIADSGYDSEPLHQFVRRRLDAMLLAPVNLRGTKTDGWRSRQPGRDASYRMLQTAKGQRLMQGRSVVERWYSLFKGSSRVGMLPYQVRRLLKVRRWVDLKLMVFFTHQYLLHKELYAVA